MENIYIICVLLYCVWDFHGKSTIIPVFNSLCLFIKTHKQQILETTFVITSILQNVCIIYILNDNYNKNIERMKKIQSERQLQEDNSISNEEIP